MIKDTDSDEESENDYLPESPFLIQQAQCINNDQPYIDVSTSSDHEKSNFKTSSTSTYVPGPSSSKTDECYR